MPEIGLKITGPMVVLGVSGSFSIIVEFDSLGIQEDTFPLTANSSRLGTQMPSASLQNIVLSQQSSSRVEQGLIGTDVIHVSNAI